MRNYFAEMYYSILYVDKMITDEDRKILIEVCDEFITHLRSDETNEQNLDYAGHFEFINKLFQ